MHSPMRKTICGTNGRKIRRPWHTIDDGNHRLYLEQYMTMRNIGKQWNIHTEHIYEQVRITKQNMVQNDDELCMFLKLESPETMFSPSGQHLAGKQCRKQADGSLFSCWEGAQNRVRDFFFTFVYHQSNLSPVRFP